jgi:hypothetical protein
MADTLGVRYYRLRQSCCTELNVTLCLGHLAQRLKEGWTLGNDRGSDNQPCYDCPAVASNVVEFRLGLQVEEGPCGNCTKKV